MTTDTELLSRITVRPDVFGGKTHHPGHADCRGTRSRNARRGDSTETILSEYDFLEEEDIRACLLFAHRLPGGRTGL